MVAVVALAREAGRVVEAERVLEEESVGAVAPALGAAQVAVVELGFQVARCALAAIVLAHCWSRGW
jgi:hypothetical protein